jgi:ADP-ribose pyrophosphatase YjhB (NUDIX family)
MTDKHPTPHMERSAGCVVVRDDKALVIRRWETPQQAAERELREETGLMGDVELGECIEDS